jgi:ATP synthase protein I
LKKKKWLSDLTFYTSWATEFAGAIIGGTLLGYFLDKRWGTSPWLMLLGFFVGTLYAYLSFWQWAKKQVK